MLSVNPINIQFLPQSKIHVRNESLSHNSSSSFLIIRQLLPRPQQQCQNQYKKWIVITSFVIVLAVQNAIIATIQKQCSVWIVLSLVQSVPLLQSGKSSSEKQLPQTPTTPSSTYFSSKSANDVPSTLAFASEFERFQCIERFIWNLRSIKLLLPTRFAMETDFANPKCKLWVKVTNRMAISNVTVTGDPEQRNLMASYKKNKEKSWKRLVMGI